MKGEWKFDMGWLEPMEYHGDELDVSVIAIDAELGKPSHTPTSVHVTDPVNRITYWVSADRSHPPEVRYKKPCLPGHFLYDLAEKAVYQMRPEDRDQMLRLMRRAMSFNQSPLPDWAKKLWEATLALVRGANVTSERNLIRSFPDGWEVRDVGGDIGRTLMPRW